MQTCRAVGSASLPVATLFVLASCGGAYAAGSSPSGPETPANGFPQSSVISVQQIESVFSSEHDSLAPLPTGVLPRMSAEAVRQQLLAAGEGLYLSDASKLTVKLGLYTNRDLGRPDGSATTNVLVYVFSGGSGDCGPRGGPPSAPAETPTPPQKPCTSVVIANATNGSVLVENQTGGGTSASPH